MNNYTTLLKHNYITLTQQHKHIFEMFIKYKISEIFDCNEQNMVLIKELDKYCVNNDKVDYDFLNKLRNVMEEITDSYSNGINPNDVILRNKIRNNLNKINSTNYDDILDSLMSLNYSNDNHFELLAKELVIKSMNDVTACKGVDNKKNALTPSEIYMKVAQKFSGYFITQNDQKIKFISVLIDVCKAYYKEFMNCELSMDKNNIHRVNNYKGFMNMIGLTYFYNIFPPKIAFSCLKNVVNIIVNSKIQKNVSQEECDNYYSGYERLIDRYLKKYENATDLTPALLKEFKASSVIVKGLNDKITSSIKKHDKPPIRKFSIMVHNNNIERLNNLDDKYKQTSNK